MDGDVRRRRTSRNRGDSNHDDSAPVRRRGPVRLAVRVGLLLPPSLGLPFLLLNVLSTVLLALLRLLLLSMNGAGPVACIP
jgi:hypothetical protein